MNEIKARKIIDDYTRSDNSLRTGNYYVSWNPGDDTICLDGHFTRKELKAFSWWMKKLNRKEVKKHMST